MPRWIQHPETGKLVPAEEYIRPRSAGHFIQGDIESFVSPIDGSVISDRKQYDEHCRKHNVVNAAEFSPEHYARKAKERERVYTGERTKEQIHQDRCRINEIFNQAERNGR